MKNLITDSRKKMSGVILIIVLVVIGSFALSKTFGGATDDLKSVSSKDLTTVQTKKILPETVNQYISTSAVTKPSSEAKINSKMMGNVANIYFEEGTWVDAGQTIIQLERDRTLLVAYDNAKVNLDSTIAAMKKEKKAAKVTIEISDGDEEEQAEANYSSVKKNAELKIAIAQGQLDSVQAQLSNTAIVAPISGVIDRIYVEVGEMVMAGGPVAEIVDTRDIEIKLSLTEFDIGKIFIEQEVEVSLAAYPDEKFTGKVHYVSSVADRVSKKFPVKIQLGNISGRIKAGIVADVKIIMDQQKDVLVVSKSAVFEEDGIEKVYVVENLKVKTKTIKTKVATEDKLKIVEGLSIGDEIIINGNYDLRDGDLVTIENQ